MKIFETFQSALPRVDFSMEDRYNKDHGFCYKNRKLRN